MNRMKRNLSQKVFVVVILLSFITPIAVSFCCCNAIAQTDSHEHGTARNGGQDDDCHRHGNESGTPHSHEKCSHPQIICNLVNQNSLQYLSSLSSSEKVTSKFLQDATFVINISSPHTKLPTLSGTGPPGSRFSPIPLFISISVLRI